MRTDQTPCSSWEAWLQICNFSLILLGQKKIPIALIPACPKSRWWIPEYEQHLACKYQSGLWRVWTGRGWDLAFFPKSPLARSSTHSVLGSHPYRGSTLLSKKQPSVEIKWEYFLIGILPEMQLHRRGRKDWRWTKRDGILLQGTVGLYLNAFVTDIWFLKNGILVFRTYLLTRKLLVTVWLPLYARQKHDQYVCRCPDGIGCPQHDPHIGLANNVSIFKKCQKQIF